MRDCSPIIVAQDQDQVDKKRRYSLTTELAAFNVPSYPGLHIPVDLFWTVDGKPVEFDIKKVSDFIASYQDGRIYKQINAMKEAGCAYYGFLIEEERDDEDEYTSPTMVGGLKHGWDWDSFDAAVLDVQIYGGCVIARSPGERYTPRRVAALWRWSGKDRTSAWAAPVPIEATNDFTRSPHIIFYDETYRSQVGTLMHLPGMGLVTANDLKEKHTFMELLGITEDGLAAAKAIWESTKGIGPKKMQAWLDWIHA